MPRGSRISFTKFSLFALLLMSVGQAACSTVNVAHRDALRDAEEARKRGDLVAAAHAFRAACTAQPDDRDSCQKAAWYSRQAVDQRVAAARPYCEPAPGEGGKAGKVDVAGCLAQLAPARALLPDDAEVVRLADAAGRAVADRCLAMPSSKPEDAVQLVRCMLAMRAEVATAGYEKLLRGAYARSAAAFVDLAALASSRDQAGAQMLLWSTAACLDGDGEVARRAELARREFVAASAIPVNMTLGVSGPPGASTSPTLAAICAETAGTLGPRAVCRPARVEVSPTAGPPAPGAPEDLHAPLSMGVVLRIGNVEHRVDEERRNVRWQSGVSRFENPRFEEARERVARADRAFREVEQETHDRDGRCQAARAELTRANCQTCAERNEAERACNDFDAANTVFQRRSQELNEARSELASTQAVLEEPVFSEQSYVVRKHRYTARWVADMSLVGGATQQASGTLSREDEEHRGVPEAGLGADPLSEPPPTWYEASVAHAVAEAAAALASGELARRANLRRGACVGDAPVWTGAWLGCWAESTLWSGTLPRGLELLVGTAHATDRFRPAAAPLPAPACLQ
jgi:hypothetical protein